MARAPKICSAVNCVNRAPCPTHPTGPWAGSTRAKQLPRNWHRIRRRVLHRDPICKHCGIWRSTDCHHLGDPNDHSLEALEGLCRDCHTAETSRQASAARHHTQT